MAGPEVKYGFFGDLSRLDEAVKKGKTIIDEPISEELKQNYEALRQALEGIGRKGISGGFGFATQNVKVSNKRLGRVKSLLEKCKVIHYVGTCKGQEAVEVFVYDNRGDPGECSNTSYTLIASKDLKGAEIQKANILEAIFDTD